MLVTGGEGDLALAIIKAYRNQFEFFTPSSKELDVTNRVLVTEYIKDKKIDVLVNNAGTIHPKTILESDMALWEKDIQVNLIGAYYVTKRVLENNRSAIVVNVSSTAAFNAYANWSSYCASTIGLVTLTKCLANDDVNAFALCPGAVKTKFRDALGLDNSNEMTTASFVEQLNKILCGDYDAGDVIFFRKNEVKINPVFSP